MTAIEEIQAAIVKLEALGMLVDPGPLIRWHDQEHIPGWDGFIVIGDSAEEGEPCNPVARVYTDELSEMIVTLHRTIDAQLALLQDTQRALLDPMFGRLTENVYAYQIALARAILGEES